MEHKEVGNQGESIAKEFLIKKGYTILESNWQYLHKEIDIIACDASNIIIVEVKTRTTTFQNPLDAVNKQKQKNLISAANSYVRQKHIDKNIRFDVVSVLILNGKIEVEHVENAFYPLLR